MQRAWILLPTILWACIPSATAPSAPGSSEIPQEKASVAASPAPRVSHDQPAGVVFERVPPGAETAPRIMGCGPGVPGCECVTLAARSSQGSCTHSLGGVYADLACSGSYQCCGGNWRQGQGACGACACVETTGRAGCAPASSGPSCTHSFGGVYGDLACSGSYQCCGGNWRQGQGACGACACVDATGRQGCGASAMPPPVGSGRGCAHSLGGFYGDRACSGGYQCCDGSWQNGQGACGACGCVEATGRQGCGSDSGQLCFPSFNGSKRSLSSAERSAMTGVTWRSGCPVALSALSMLEIPHWRFDGTIGQGRLVVASAVADAVLGVFQRLYEARFPIERMEPIVAFGGDDDLSMEANNTSAFNCRRVTGGSRFSQHSYGDAIDINPVQNPYVRGGTVLPPAGRSYTDRGRARAGMILRSDEVNAAFSGIGWAWGGNFSSLKDYQHFSSNGR